METALVVLVDYLHRHVKKGHAFLLSLLDFSVASDISRKHREAELGIGMSTGLDQIIPHGSDSKDFH